MASSELPFLEIYDRGITLKVFFEYFHMAPMTEASDGMISSCLFWKYMILVSFESVFGVLSVGNDVIMSHCLFCRNIS